MGTLFIILYITVWLLATNFLTAWFKSSFSIYLLKGFKVIPADIMTNEDMFTYLVVNKGKIGELLSCPICLATWITAIISALVVIVYPQIIIGWKFIPLCSFTLPFLSTLILNKQ